MERAPQPPGFGEIEWDFVPANEVELELCLSDPVWRVCSGQLYKILVKSDDGDEGKIVPFHPNHAQIRLLRRLHTRNLILKARQLGFTTLVCILWLDHALFNSHQRCAIIAHDLPSAQSIFRDKVKLAYDHLPDVLREAMPLKTDSQTELLFAHNNSAFKVAVSVRSGTIDRLHVSEFGKIAAKFPQKAAEVLTGSLPAVPFDGIAIIESTAEGQGGPFHDMVKKAEALAEQGKALTAREWRFHFYPWHSNAEYEMDPEGVIITPADHEYFDKLEAEHGLKLPMRKRAWYVATRESDFAGDAAKMWQEYPSTSKEAFQVSTEGTYYATQLTRARKEGRITRVPVLTGVPVNTFWDIGSSDGTAIWLHQYHAGQHRFVGFIEGWGEPYSYFLRKLQDFANEHGCIWGTHYLPHDAEHQRQGLVDTRSPVQQLRESMPGWDFEVVPRIGEVIHGIQMVRDQFSTYWFDEVNCAAGLAHLAAYRKEWDDRLGTWKDKPRHDEHSEAADALRQHAQGFRVYGPRATGRPNRRNKSGMAA